MSYLFNNNEVSCTRFRTLMFNNNDSIYRLRGMKIPSGKMIWYYKFFIPFRRTHLNIFFSSIICLCCTRTYAVLLLSWHTLIDSISIVLDKHNKLRFECWAMAVTRYFGLIALCFFFLFFSRSLPAISSSFILLLSLMEGPDPTKMPIRVEITVYHNKVANIMR